MSSSTCGKSQHKEVSFKQRFKTLIDWAVLTFTGRLFHRLGAAIAKAPQQNEFWT